MPAFLHVCFASFASKQKKITPKPKKKIHLLVEETLIEHMALHVKIPFLLTMRRCKDKGNVI